MDDRTARGPRLRGVVTAALSTLLIAVGHVLAGGSVPDLAVLVVLFPLTIWFAAWLSAHPRARVPALVCSGLLLAFSTAQFATWHWVA